MFLSSKYFFPKKYFKPLYLTVFGLIFFIVCMIIFPTAVFQASKAGLAVWWNIVLPALLPFFISSELLMGYGIVQFMGVLFEPVMRPLFNLPGAASFVMAVGYTSGFPISASLTAKLRNGNRCTRLEAEKLISFTNNASPLFMLVAVGVGMFNSPQLGILIAVCHYTANICLGLLLRFYRSSDPEFTPGIIIDRSIFRQAISEMKKSYRENPRPFGKMLGDAISSSISKLLTIGGFMVIFSIIINISSILGFNGLLAELMGFILLKLGFSHSMIQAMSSGFFEITLGAKAVSQTAAPLMQKITAVSMILGWSGLSVIAQVAAMVNQTDIRISLFIICRFAHSILAGLLCYFLMTLNFIRSMLAPATSVGYYLTPRGNTPEWFTTLCFSGRICIIAVTAWFISGFFIHFVRTFSVIRIKI